MSITVGVNSWVTIAETDTYLTSHIGAADWFLLDDNPATPGAESKESYLVEAFYRLLYSADYTLTPTLTNTGVKNAQIEFAFFLFKNYNDYTKREAKIASGIESFTYSKWREKLGDAVKVPVIVDGMIINEGFSGSNFFTSITVD